ncbi:MAG: prepilin-type N-terminal cleavage/methylation domain-containing protein [Candidatus Eremiobacteraeota bacterium]|nr:prepilin-type N-terminal cleavage/methylation domain-containing protein [Candidatus Eremiobacteraeota bacterium]
MTKLRKKNKGMTLAETMVYAVLLGIVLTGIYGVFVSSMKYFRVGETRTVLHQNALLVMSKLCGDMAGTRGSSIIIETSQNPSGLIFVSARNSNGNYEFDSDGQLKWQKWVCYYLKDIGNGRYDLMLKESYLTTPSSDPGVCPYTSVQQFAQSSLKDISVGRGMQSMTIVKATDLQRYDFNLVFDQTTDTTKPNQLAVQTSIFVRN